MVKVRSMEREDLPGAQSVLKAAFGRPGKDPLFNEWTVAEAIMEDEGFIRELCLVAQGPGGIEGYILLTRAAVGQSEGLVLGPLAVAKERQGEGIGSELVRAALQKARAAGFDWVALTGGPYYERFGFAAASPLGITLGEGHPENPFLQIHFLGPAKAPQGALRYAGPFYNDQGELL